MSRFTSALSSEFGGMDDHVWLNAAHQGVLPLPAADAAARAIHWKRHPYHMNSEAFRQVPEKMRGSLAELIDVSPNEIAISNSASYGIHVIVHCYPWRAGDEVLLVENDFPTNHLPWQLLAKRGVKVRTIVPKSGAPTPEEIEAAIGPHTRLLCSSWVFSFSGYTADLASIGKICRDREVAFVVNASQGLGGMALYPGQLPVDAVVSVGCKWLCGPYGTGLLWLHPNFQSQLDLFKNYWLSVMTETDLEKEGFDPQPNPDLEAKAYDIFEPANFFNLLPWQAAVDHILEIGIDSIESYDRSLVERFHAALEGTAFDILSPDDGPTMSNLVYFSHREAKQNRGIFAHLTQRNIHIGLRRGALRISPHLYNSPDEIDTLVEAVFDAAV